MWFFLLSGGFHFSLFFFLEIKYKYLSFIIFINQLVVCLYFQLIFNSTPEFLYTRPYIYLSTYTNTHNHVHAIVSKTKWKLKASGHPILFWESGFIFFFHFPSQKSTQLKSIYLCKCL